MTQSIKDYWTHAQPVNKLLETFFLVVIFLIVWCVAPLVYEFVAVLVDAESFFEFVKKTISSNASIDSVWFFIFFGLIAVFVIIFFSLFGLLAGREFYFRVVNIVVVAVDQILCFVLNWTCVLFSAIVYSDAVYGRTPWSDVLAPMVWCFLGRWLFVTLGAAFEEYIKAGRKAKSQVA